MTNQLPPPGAVFLDHVAHFVPEMDAAAAALERRVQFLTHHTEPLVWRDGFLDHPNGARALTGLWIAAREPAEPTARFGRFTGRPASHAGGVTTIALERGAIHIARPRYLRDAFGITPAGTLPCFVATQIAVADLAILERCLREAGLSSRPVRLEHFCVRWDRIRHWRDNSGTRWAEPGRGAGRRFAIEPLWCARPPCAVAL